MPPEKEPTPKLVGAPTSDQLTSCHGMIRPSDPVSTSTGVDGPPPTDTSTTGSVLSRTCRLTVAFVGVSAAAAAAAEPASAAPGALPDSSASSDVSGSIRLVASAEPATSSTPADRSSWRLAPQ